MVKKIFPTMQGEGSRTGVPCVFIRFAGCNLWSGFEAGRQSGRGACALWCDTEFTGGSKLEYQQVIDRVVSLMDGWPAPAVVISGGEPCLQLRRPEGEHLVDGLRTLGVHVAVETNGTVDADVLVECDHVTVSPKQLRGSDELDHILVRTGTDLKVVWPQWPDEAMAQMAAWSFEHRYLQPLDDGTDPVLAAQRALAHAGPLGWRVSVQTHKFLEIE